MIATMMTTNDTIEFAKAFANHGPSIANQAAAIIDDPTEECFSERNPNDIRQAATALSGYHGGVDDAFGEYFAWLENDLAGWAEARR